MLAITWQCALCGAVNPEESAFCGNCGTASAMVTMATERRVSDANASGNAGVPNKTIAHVATPAIPSPSATWQRSVSIWLLGGLKIYTDIVMVAERNTKKQTEIQSVYGELGRVVATHTIDSFTHDIRLRVIVQSTDRPLQIPVQVNIDRTFLLLQEGDLITLIGRPTREELFKDPAILNHAGRFAVMPAGWSWRATFFAWLLAIGGYYFWSATAQVLKRQISLSVQSTPLGRGNRLLRGDFPDRSALVAA